MTRNVKAVLSIVLAVGVGLIAVPGASAEFLPKENFGEHTTEPLFAAALAMAVEPTTGDLLVLDAGATEKQNIHFTNVQEGSKFTLTWTPPGGSPTTTEQITFSFNETSFRNALQSALDAKFGAGNIAVTGTTTGFDSFAFLEFVGPTYAEARQALLSCQVVSGTGSCSETSRLVIGGARGLYRFKPNGEADPFSALGSNLIDGKGTGGGPGTSGVHPCVAPTPPSECDETPEDGLPVSDSGDRVQIAVAPPSSAGGTGGDIYVAEDEGHAVGIFAPSGEYIGQLTNFASGLDASGSSVPLGQVTGVGVDAAGTVYVSDLTNNEIHKYVPTANPVANADNEANFSLENPAGLAPGSGSTGGVLFADQILSHAVNSLDASNGQACLAVPGNQDSVNIAVNTETGHLLTVKENAVGEYDGECPSSLLASVSGSRFSSIAIDGAHSLLYVAAVNSVAVYREVGLAQPKTLAATSIGLTSATLNGEVKPNGAAVTECFFQWGETAPNYGHTIPCEEYESGGTWHPLSSLAELGAGSTPVPVRSAIPAGELGVGSTYHFQLRAANANNASGETVGGGDKSFLTLGPSLRAEAASEVGEEDAIVAAEVNPNGKAASYQVQYLSEAQFEATGWIGAAAVPATPAALGEGSEFLPVSQHLTGLAPGTVYRFRIVATNPDGANEGAGALFTTFPATSEALLDGRAYEMVTPVAKKGEPIPPEPNNQLGGSCDPTNPCLPGVQEKSQPLQARPDGESVLYSGQPFATGLTSGKNTYLSGRTPSGWNWASLSPRTQTGTWEAFSADLSRGVLAQTEPPLSPSAPVRGGRAFANLYLRDGSGALTPLLTSEPPNRDPGVENTDFTIRFAGANAGTPAAEAFSHVVFEADDALTAAVPGLAPQAPPVQAGRCLAPTFGGVSCDLYEWSSGGLSLVNVAPGNGSALGGAAIGSGRLLERNTTYEAPGTDNAISADGRTIFWTSKATGQTYARIDAERTLEIPGPASCKASVAIASRACFLTASQDGDEVLLSDGELFELNGAGTAYVLDEDLTEGQGGFEGSLATGEEDGHITRIYFADPKALTGAATNAEGESAAEEAGHVNLYYWHEGALRFVASLLAGDDHVEREYGDWRAAQADRTAQATGDGRFLAFMSRAPLTGYGNTRPDNGRCGGGANTGSVCFEVFEYDAETGELTCPSCNPTGEAPLGLSNLTRLYVVADEVSDFRQPQNLPADGDGRIFFESQDALSPHDHNGHVQDVYEWEPKGVGDCASEAAEGGCLRLISSGRSGTDSTFVDSTPTGDDAFFITRSKLLPGDKNEQLDLYDARAPHVPGEAVGFAEEARPAPCEGEACKGEATVPPVLPGAGSASFTGPGNPKPKAGCPKGKVKRHGKCVKKHRHHKRKTGHGRKGGGK